MTMHNAKGLEYPIVFMIMPKLWGEAKRHGHVTAADVVYGTRTRRDGESW